MAVTLTGTGGLFTRIGREGGALNGINTNRSSAFTTYETNIQAQYLASLQDVVTNLFTQGNSWIAAQNGFLTYLKTAATDTIIDMVHNDVYTVPETITASLTELIRQMYVSSDTVNKPTVSGTSTYGNGVWTNTGTGKAGVSVKRGDGVQLDYAYNETVILTCSNDAQSGTATASEETFTYTGYEATSNQLSQLWPTGSGCTGTISCVSATQEQDTASNLLNNSNFEDFTANLPDKWTKVTGTAGSNITSSPGNAYTGTNCLDLLGDAATNMNLYQQFNTAGQTTAALQPDTVYLFSVWLKKEAAATGTIRFSLKDSAGTITADDQTVSNSTTVDISTLSSSVYGNTQAFFRTPRLLASANRLTIDYTVVQNAKNLYVDEMTFQEATQLYNGGPYVGVVAGSVNWILGDVINVAISNNYGGVFQKLFQRFFDMNSKNLIIPSSTSPTINDNLVA